MPHCFLKGGFVMKKSIGAKTVAYATPVWVVGSYDSAGKANVMTAAWAGICCSKPPCIGVSLRKATYTYGNIMARQAFSVNVPSESHVKEVDYFGIATGKSVDKFAASGLTAVRCEHADAPYVKEFPLILECKVIQTVEIGLHTQFIGEIMDVKAEEAALGEKGLPEIEKVRPILFGPEIFSYHGLGTYLGRAFSIGKQS
jgi:flavin reductase (DIM6/NTAB) family NADH-FMN oxidoreductase RutF